jgi:hypothetical protein
VAEDAGVAALLILIYKHPAVALPVIGAILLATAFLLPLLLRALAFLLAGLRGALRAVVSRGGRDEIPVWVELKALELAPEGTSPILPCVARQVKGVPRLGPAYLVLAEGQWHLVHRRWFRTRSLAFDAALGPARVFPGFLWDTTVFLLDRKPQVLLVRRDWRHALPAAAPGT